MDSTLSHQQDDGSPYINEMNLVPPSPSSVHLNLDIDQPSPYDSTPSGLFNNSLASPPSAFSHSSYNSGSYHNSPYSNHSELSYVGEDITFNIFDDNDPAADLYNPADYDPPQHGSSLLMFSNDDNIGYHPYPSQNSANSIGSEHRGYDYGSPASSNGGDDGRRSRASSVSSNPNQSASAPNTAGSNPNATQYSPSPRLEVAQSFENLTFHSPAVIFNNEPLPSSSPIPSPLPGHSPIPHHSPLPGHSPLPRHSPLPQSLSQQQQKPPSPPRLQMEFPDAQNTPQINAPEGDDVGGGGGPMLQIVPATPINVGAGNAPFHGSLETVHQGSTLGTPSWGVNPERHQQLQSPPQQQQQQQQQQQGKGLSSSTSGGDFVFPQQHNHTHLQGTSTGSRILDDGAIHRSISSNGDNYLLPGPQRGRSKSETSLDPPTWDVPSMQQFGQQQHQASAVEDVQSGTVNMQDVLSNPMAPYPSQQQQHQQQQQQAQQQQQTQSSPQTLGQGFTFPGNQGYLSPDIGALHAANLRRSKSDSGSRPNYHRQSKSEDIRLPPATQHPSLISHQGHQGHGHSQSTGHFLFPPNQDFMQPGGGGSGYLSADASPHLPPRSLTPGVRAPGHIRRTSSGSRSERGAEAWVGVGGIPVGSARVTPYPSPNASPRVRYDELPPVPNSAGYENEVALSGRGGGGLLHQPQPSHMLGLDPYSMQGMGLSGMGGVPGPSKVEMDAPIAVSKPQVTTGRTANASHKRRKQEATFVCPVPGCGSTFTRSFNLKGHIRSHNEEKPFQCHWPGCGKGFARQHDCKRHEQLHTNYRPFTCDGCHKQFARMDALNRHLRSEGGAECAKLQEANGGPGYSATPPGQGQSNSPPGSRGQSQISETGLKLEDNWATLSGGVTV